MLLTHREGGTQSLGEAPNPHMRITLHYRFPQDDLSSTDLSASESNWASLVSSRPVGSTGWIEDEERSSSPSLAAEEQLSASGGLQGSLGSTDLLRSCLYHRHSRKWWIFLGTYIGPGVQGWHWDASEEQEEPTTDSPTHADSTRTFTWLRARRHEGVRVKS